MQHTSGVDNLSGELRAVPAAISESDRDTARLWITRLFLWITQVEESLLTRVASLQKTLRVFDLHRINCGQVQNRSTE